MNEEQLEDFKEWWRLVGSGIAPYRGEDHEEFAKRIALRAYEACLDVENLLP